MLHVGKFLTFYVPEELLPYYQPLDSILNQFNPDFQILSV
jgi:hypothetical protein